MHPDRTTEPRIPPAAAGFSLVELMVALALGGLLLIGLVAIFDASRTASQLAEGVSRVQENGRFAMDFLQRDLRMGGHFGCVNDQSHLQTGVATFNLLFAATRTPAGYGAVAAPLRFHVSVSGHEFNGTGPTQTYELPAEPVVAGPASWTPALPAGLAGDVVQGSDVIVLRYLASEGVPVTGFNLGSPTIVNYDPAFEGVLYGGMVDPGLFGLADCINVLVFQAGAATAGEVTIPAVPQGLNASGFEGTEQFGLGQATLHRAESIALYIGLNASGEPALFRRHFTAAPGAGAVVPVTEELVEGIESMQLLYGIDAIDDLTELPSGYMEGLATAAGIPNSATWLRVGIVQIGLLARSPIRTSSAPPEDAPRVLGTTFTPPGDGRLRTIYESHIALRNRLFGN